LEKVAESIISRIHPDYSLQKQTNNTMTVVLKLVVTASASPPVRIKLLQWE
jgi:hypothetical protein